MIIHDVIEDIHGYLYITIKSLIWKENTLELKTNISESYTELKVEFMDQNKYLS
jgi:hypothetical protein